MVSLFTNLKEVGIPKGCAEAEDVVPFWVLWYRLHDRTINNNEVLGGCLNRASLSGVTWIEEKGGALEAYPVALPASLACQLYLVLFPKQPFLHTQKSESGYNKIC
jgi:hypothetical protein